MLDSSKMERRRFRHASLQTSRISGSHFAKCKKLALHVKGMDVELSFFCFFGKRCANCQKRTLGLCAGRCVFAPLRLLVALKPRPETSAPDVQRSWRMTAA